MSIAYLSHPVPVPSPLDVYHSAPRTSVTDAPETAAFELEVLRATHNFALLQKHRYHFLPIASLPAELLVDIFRYVAALPADPGVGQPGSIRYDVLTLSHVCRHWRELALGTPSLWTILDDRTLGTRLALEAAHRSCTLPLVISTHGAHEAVAQALSLAGRHTSRLRELDVSRDTRPPSQAGSKQPAPAGPSMLRDLPLLERLTVKPTTVVGHFVLGAMPRVQAIDFRAISFSWSNASSPLPNLTHLSLSAIPATARYGPEQLLKLLARTPALQSLRLESVFSGCSTPALVMQHDELRVSLPSLREFSLNEVRPDPCTALLRCLDLPLDVRFHHTLSCMWTDPRCLPLCAAVAESVQSVRGEQAWRSVDMKIQLSPPMVKIRASPSELSPSADEDWPVAISLPFDKADGPGAQVSSILGRAASSVREMSLSHGHWVLSAWIRDALRGLDAAERFTMSYHTAAALREDCGQSAQQATSPLLLPALRDLVVRWNSGDYAAPNGKLSGEHVSALRTLFDSRAQLRAPLQTLRLDNFTPVVEDVSYLASLAPVVTVGGTLIVA